MAEKKTKKVIDVSEEGEESLVAGQSTPPQNKVEKAILREGAEKAESTVKTIMSENEEETDPEKRRQTDLELQKHFQKADSMEGAEDEVLPEAEKTKKAGWVKVNMYETIEPPPTVGDFNVGSELRIPRMQARATYSVPKNVADVLVDARKASRVD